MSRRRTITMRTRFEPTRLAQEQLRLAYEMVAPIRSVQIRSEGLELQSEVKMQPERRERVR